MIQGQRKKSSYLSTREGKRLHPYQTVMYLAMVTSGFLFITMLGMYTIQRFGVGKANLPIPVPKMFVISTILLLASSYTVHIARSYIRKDQLKKTVNFLLLTLALGVGFTAFQVAGWIEFYTNGVQAPTGHVAPLYIYVLSSIHLLHLLMAFGFMGYILVPAYRKSRDMVDELIHITNPYQRKKVDMLAVFWHYIDGVWLLLFFYFLLTA